MEWDVNAKEAALVNAQESLESTQAVLFQERDNSLRLLARIDELTIAREHDQRKIAFLLALTRNSSADGEVTFFMPASQAPPTHRRRPPPRTSVVIPTSTRGEPPQPTSLELPREDALNALRATVASLRKQLAEQRELATQHSTSLLAGREEVLETLRSIAVDQKQRLADTQAELDRVRALLFSTTRDFLSLKHEQAEALRTAAEEKHAAAERLVDEASRLAAERSRVEQRQHAITADQARQWDDAVSTIRSQNARLHGQLSAAQTEVDSMRSLIASLRKQHGEQSGLSQKRLAELARRRQLESEGYRNELHRLRQYVQRLEHDLHSICAAVMGDGGDGGGGLLSAKALAALQKIAESNRRSKTVLGELQHVRSAVWRLEDKVAQV
jgi:coiled-coil domain-containing protein 77